MEQKSEFYTRKTEDGEVLCRDYVWRRKTYRQETLTLGRAKNLSKIFLGLNVEGLSDVFASGSFDIQSVVRAVLASDMEKKILACLLVNDDGTDVDETDFTKGLAAPFLDFFTEIVLDFFELNPELTTNLLNLLIRVLADIAEKVREFSLSAAPFISSLAATSPAEQPSNESAST